MPCPPAVITGPHHGGEAFSLPSRLLGQRFAKKNSGGDHWAAAWHKLIPRSGLEGLYYHEYYFKELSTIDSQFAPLAVSPSVPHA